MRHVVRGSDEPITISIARCGPWSLARLRAARGGRHALASARAGPHIEVMAARVATCWTPRC
jgi:hypothetical protein